MKPAKTCTQCGATKSLDEFQRDRRRKSGRASRCKVCGRAQARAWSLANSERHRARTKNWQKRNPERQAAYNKRWREENPERRAEHDKLYRERHRDSIGAKNKRWRKQRPVQDHAWRTVDTAIRRGKLSKPPNCEDCGSKVEDPRNLHAHHDDYSRPLEVEWLCRGCHAGRHRAPDRQALRDLPVREGS